MFRRIALLLAVCVLYAAASAETLAIPGGSLEISDGAFESCERVTRVILPEGMLSLGDGAFRDCVQLNQVILPASLSTIGQDCFDGCAEALCFTCTPASYSAEWARASNYDYSAETQCQALVIGQNYTGTNMVLYGPVNDARAMAFCLRQMKTRPYAVTQRTNLTTDGILEAIAETFAGAGEDDISLFFFAGHGETDGSLLGSDLTPLAPSRLRAAMDAVPGRKVLIVDACYSGALLEDPPGADDEMLLTATSEGEDAFPTDFTSAFCAAFARRMRSAFDGANRYYLLTSAHYDETSAETYLSSENSGRFMGCFTYALCLGCGWDGVANTVGEMSADVNGDGAVTLYEACHFADEMAREYNEAQSALAYPTKCTEFAPFRK